MEKFGIGPVQAATGCTTKDIANWQRADLLLFPLEPSGRGKVRGYTIENIYEFAILRELSSYGVHLKPISQLIIKEAVQTMVKGKGLIFSYSKQNPNTVDYYNTSLAHTEYIFQKVLNVPHKTSTLLVHTGLIRERVDAALSRFTPLD